jgi:ribosomal protein L3 glutamine methyltransferase
MTIADWIERCRAAMAAADLHFGHGTDNAGDEAAWLVLHACEAPCDGSFADWGRAVTALQAQRISSLLERRIAERTPLAYLLGEAWFCGLRFRVNREVLVPRSPIAELIRHQFRPWVDPGAVRKVLDLCTGCGCLAVATAQHLPRVEADAADVSAAALDVAADNIERHGLAGRVRPVESDLFGALRSRRYDLIVANPPYVPEAALASLPAEYRAEPALGLRAGRDGLGVLLEILARAAGHLADRGVLICEAGESADRLRRLLEPVPFTWVEFEQGGEGVFTIGRTELLQAESAVRRVLAAR